MPQIIDIPLVGQVEFPDTMSDDDIGVAAKKLHTEHIQGLHATNVAAGKQFDEPQTNLEGIKQAGQGFVEGAKNLLTGVPSALWQGLTRPAGAEMERQQAVTTKAAQEPTSTLSSLTQLERIPLIGPAAAAIGQTAGELTTPQSAKSFGKFTGEQLAPLAIGEGISKGAGAIGARRAAKATARYEPEMATNEALKALNVKGTGGIPGAAKAPEIEYMNEALPEIHHELVTKGADFSQVKQRGFAQAAQRVKKSGWQESVGEDLKKFGHNLEPTTPVAENIYNSIGELTQEANPKLAETIKQRAAIYDGKHRSLNSIHERIKELRKTRESLNNPLTRAEILNTPEMAANMRELDGLEKAFTDRMSTLSGKDYKKLNFRYKALSNVEELARDAAGAQEVKTAQEAATRMPILNKALESKGLYEAGAKVAKGIKDKYLKTDPNNPDLLISSALKRLGGKSRRVEIGPRASTAGSEGTTLMQPPPEGPYAGQPGPTEPGQSMEQYLNMNNVSPEAQRFLGFRETPLKRIKSLSSPPERPQ